MRATWPQPRQVIVHVLEDQYEEALASYRDKFHWSTLAHANGLEYGSVDALPKQTLNQFFLR